MKRLFIYFCLAWLILCCGETAKAQAFHGKVVGQNDLPLVYVHLMLFNPTDESFVQSSISGENGEFSFDVTKREFASFYTEENAKEFMNWKYKKAEEAEKNRM